MHHFENTMLIAQGAAAPSFGIWAMAIGFALICIIMMLVVLIQKPKGGGLSGAFGGGAGGGSTQAVIGARVGDVLTVVTVICFVLFLLLACGMTWGINGTAVAEENNEEQVDNGGAGAPGDETTDETIDTPGTEDAGESEAEAESGSETEAEAESEETEPAGEDAAP